MPSITEPKLISGNANLPLAKAIARRMSIHRGYVGQPGRGPRSNASTTPRSSSRCYENVRGEDMFIIQSHLEPRQ